MKVNFEVKSYKAKADAAIAKTVVGEGEFCERVLKRFGLNIGEGQKKALKKRERILRKGADNKKKPSTKKRRAERKAERSNKGVSSLHYYKDPKKSGEKVLCGCKGECETRRCACNKQKKPCGGSCKNCHGKCKNPFNVIDQMLECRNKGEEEGGEEEQEEEEELLNRKRLKKRKEERPKRMRTENTETDVDEKGEEADTEDDSSMLDCLKGTIIDLNTDEEESDQQNPGDLEETDGEEFDAETESEPEGDADDEEGSDEENDKLEEPRTRRSKF